MKRMVPLALYRSAHSDSCSSVPRPARRLCALMAILLSAGCAAHAQLNADAFLKVRPSARQAGMGGVSCAVAGDVSCLESNPAGLAPLRGHSAALAHTEWFADVRNEHLSYAYGAPLVSAGIAINRAGVKTIVRRDALGNKTGSFDVSYGLDELALARRVYRGLAVGAGVRGITETVAARRAAVYAYDAGLLFTAGDTAVGASAQNMGPGLRLDRETFDLPFLTTVGVWQGIAPGFHAGLDAEQEKGQPLSLKVGAEYEFKVRYGIFYRFYHVSIRAGYVHTDAARAGSGVSAGLGYRKDGIGMHYAYVPYGDLGDTHRLSLLIYVH